MTNIRTYNKEFWKRFLLLLCTATVLLFFYKIYEAKIGKECSELNIKKEVQKAEKPKIVVDPIQEKPKAPVVRKHDTTFLQDLWNYVYDKKYICSNLEYLGTVIKNFVVADGAYYLCKDKEVWPFTNETKERCLVYSFGISYNYKFDDAIAKTGCEVHAFDPSTNLKEGKLTESGVIFHKIGISDKDNDKGFKGWKMRTLKTLIKELGHENRVLDYLKVDTDRGDGTGFEYEVLQQLVNTGLYKCVRQYAMEIHLPGPLSHPRFTKLAKDLYSFMTTLEAGGFRLYQNVDNYRAIKSTNPKANQLMVKRSQFAGHGDVVLWETHFVNVDVKGTCKDVVV